MVHKMASNFWDNWCSINNVGATLVVAQNDGTNN